MTKRIKLTQGKFALVDDSDYEYLNQFKWHVDSYNYAVRTVWVKEQKSKHIKMHRELLKTPLFVDHIDGNGCNNQRKNLRSCTRAQNLQNRGKNKNNTHGYKGVSLDKRRVHQKNPFKAEIMVNRKKRYLGSFSTAKEAHRAYKEAAKKYHGEFAKW